MARRVEVLEIDDDGWRVEAVYQDTKLVLASCPKTFTAFIQPIEFIEDLSRIQGEEKKGPLADVFWKDGRSIQ